MHLEFGGEPLWQRLFTISMSHFLLVIEPDSISPFHLGVVMIEF